MKVWWQAVSVAVVASGLSAGGTWASEPTPVGQAGGSTITLPTTPPLATAARSCGRLRGSYVYRITKRGTLKCTSARRVAKAFLRGGRGVVTHTTDGTVAGTYYTLRRYPGWRCIEGSGGGSCSRRSRTVAWQTRSS